MYQKIIVLTLSVAKLNINNKISFQINICSLVKFTLKLIIQRFTGVLIFSFLIK